MRYLAVALAIALVALAAASAVAAKGGVRATLLAPNLVRSPAGTEIELAWRLSYVDHYGVRQPYAADGVFIRLFSRGGTSEEHAGSYWSQPTGDYTAKLVVPEGGIEGVEIGMAGSATGGRRDLLFPITNYSATAGDAVAAPASDDGEHEPRAREHAAIAAVGLTLAGVIAGAGVARRRSRRNEAS